MRASPLVLGLLAFCCFLLLSTTLISAASSCPVGQYDTTKCIQCPSGFYCPGGSSAPKKPCPYGYHCPTGASAPLNRIKGINLSYGSNEASNIPGIHGKDYLYPTIPELDYFRSRGMKIVRVAFSIGRMQPTTNGPLATNEVKLISAVVANARARGLICLLNPHNYGHMWDPRYGNYSYIGVPSPTYYLPTLPATAFGDFWGKMAQVFANQTDVWFGLMNEPHFQTAKNWYDVAVVAVTSIRTTGATQNKILIPGTSWTGAHSWIKSGNAAVWQNFSDPNFAFEVHQYLDADSSGTHAACKVNKSYVGLVDVTNWARTRSAELFLGEFGYSDTAQCYIEARSMVGYMTNNSDVWLGWTYWAAGLWWGDYMFSVEPTSFTQPIANKPQMSVLLENILPDWNGTGLSSSSSSSTAALSSSSSSSPTLPSSSSSSSGIKSSSSISSTSLSSSSTAKQSSSSSASGSSSSSSGSTVVKSSSSSTSISPSSTATPSSSTNVKSSSSSSIPSSSTATSSSTAASSSGIKSSSTAISSSGISSSSTATSSSSGIQSSSTATSSSAVPSSTATSSSSTGIKSSSTSAPVSSSTVKSTTASSSESVASSSTADPSSNIESCSTGAITKPSISISSSTVTITTSSSTSTTAAVGGEESNSSGTSGGEEVLGSTASNVRATSIVLISTLLIGLVLTA